MRYVHSNNIIPKTEIEIIRSEYTNLLITVIKTVADKTLMRIWYIIYNMYDRYQFLTVTIKYRLNRLICKVPVYFHKSGRDIMMYWIQRTF